MADSTLSFSGGFSYYPWTGGDNGIEQNTFKQYNNCHECYSISMHFGSASINTEEQFEILKGIFVKHFNEKHQDIMRNRTKSSVKKQFKKIVSDDLPTFSNMNYNYTTGDWNGIQIITSNNTEPPERINNININNMDRNERFRHRLANR